MLEVNISINLRKTSGQLKCQIGNIELIMYLECVMIQPVNGMASLAVNKSEYGFIFLPQK